MRRIENISIFLLPIFVLISMELTAQADDSTKLSQRRPKHGDHNFVYLTGARTPEMNSEVFTFMGGGQTSDLQYQIFDIDGWDGIGLTGSVVFVHLNAKYQQLVRDWLSVFVRYNVASRIGTDVQSVLGHGVNTITSFEIGWKLKVYQGNKSILSTSFELQNHSGNFMNISKFIKDIIGNNPNASITQNIPVLTGGVGIQYAYGINDLFGLSTYIDVGYGETYVRGKNAVRFLAGASFDVNFYERYDFPIGLAVNGALNSEPDLVYVDGKIAKLIQFKVAYTGSLDFSLGIEIGAAYTPLPGVKDDPLFGTIGLASRYYF